MKRLYGRNGHIPKDDFWLDRREARVIDAIENLYEGDPNRPITESSLIRSIGRTARCNDWKARRMLLDLTGTGLIYKAGKRGKERVYHMRSN